MRTTNEPKLNGFRIRFTGEQAEWLKNQSKIQNLPVAEIVRRIVKKSIKSSGKKQNTGT